MIKQISLKNFKCFDSLNLDNLQRITLISGKNNIGKSSLLESLFFANNKKTFDSLLRMHKARGTELKVLTPEVLWDPFFFNQDPKNKIEISEKFLEKAITVKCYVENTKIENASLEINSAEGLYTTNNYPSLVFESEVDKKKSRSVLSITGVNSMNQSNINLNSNKLPNVIYLDTHINRRDSIVEAFSKLDIAGKKQPVINALNLLDSDIQDISVVVTGGVSQIYAATSKSSKKIPLQSMGDGLNRLLSMIIMILANPNSVILIDEIENGFHYSLHVELWKVLASAAFEVNSQIIATTHSYECISASVKGVAQLKKSDDYVYIRIDRVKGLFVPKYYSSDLMNQAVDSEMEVR